MIRAIMLKSIRETWWMLLLAVAAILLFESLFCNAMGQFAGELPSLLSRRPVLRNFIQMLVGTDIGEVITPTALVTIGLAHPFLLAVSWGLLLTVCTRSPAGDVERGTADLLYTLPASRVWIYTVTTAHWALVALILAVMPWIGIALGERLNPLWEPIELDRFLLPTMNFFALLLAVGSLATFTSAALSRRGLAIGIALAFLLLSFMIDALALFWDALKPFNVFGVMRYYQPLVSARSGEWPLSNLGVLGGAALALWGTGACLVARRDMR